MQSSYKIFCSQVSGKQPKLVSEDQKFILKGYEERQANFYKFMGSLQIHAPSYKLNHFIPKFQGAIDMTSFPIIETNENVKDENTLIWLQHLKIRVGVRNPQNKFLKLGNIVHKYKKPNIIDIKIGVRDDTKQYTYGKMLSKDYFMLNGCRMSVKSQMQNKNELFETFFLSKYFYKSVKTDELILEHLALYFFDGEVLRTKLLRKTIQKLRQLIIQFKTLLGWSFYSTSLCLFYDASQDNHFQVKLIDFARAVPNKKGLTVPNHQSILGLQNIHKILMKIQRSNAEDINERLNKLKNTYIQQAVLVVPQRKHKEYQTLLAAKQCSQLIENAKIQPKNQIENEQL